MLLSLIKSIRLLRSYVGCLLESDSLTTLIHLLYLLNNINRTKVSHDFILLFNFIQDKGFFSIKIIYNDVGIPLVFLNF